jgi:hypothetical protein
MEAQDYDATLDQGDRQLSNIMAGKAVRKKTTGSNH